MAILWAVAALLLGSGHACTNFIVTRGATADQSTMFANTADAGGLHGALPHFPAGKHAPGAKRKLHDLETGRYLSEFGVAIGETKFGGNGTLAGGDGIMDYGSLMW